MPSLHTRSLRKLIKQTCPNPTLGCEVGVWMGVNSKHLLNSFQSLTLYMIDSYHGLDPRDCKLMHCDSPLETITSALLAIDNTDEYAERRIFMICSSLVAATIIPDGSLDFVFIDATHRSPDIDNDCDAWHPKVRSGGLVAGHDYSHFFPDVKAAVDSLTQRLNVDLLLRSGRIWGFVKP